MPQVQIIEPTIRPQEQKIRVCAYARVSSDSDDQLNSFSAQVEYFTKLIQAHEDWEFIDIYADEGITGTRADNVMNSKGLCVIAGLDGLTVYWLNLFPDLAETVLTAFKLYENSNYWVLPLPLKKKALIQVK